MESFVSSAISDSRGEKKQQVAKAAISQLDKKEDMYEIRRFPYVSTKEILLEILKGAKTENAIVVYTLVSENLGEIVEEFCQKEGLHSVDLMSKILNILTNKIGDEPKREPGIIRKMNEEYFRRIEAIEFAVKYDDGKDPRGVLNADLVLVGISRTSKTPLSMYLANRNIKVANIPLVPEIPIPKEVFEINPKKIIGLTNSPEDRKSVV